jgi:uncharacterized membrane protein
MSASTARCETFSDGIFAIAVTLLVLEIRLPHASSGGHLWADLVALWPSYCAFAFSFFVIVVSWIIHHDLLRLVRAVNRPFLLANAFFLLYVTFVPFSTSVLASHLVGPERSTAVAFYCGVFIFGSVASIVTLETIVSRNLFRPEVDARSIRLHRRALWIGLATNIVATLLALLLPVLALAIVFAVRLGWLCLPYEVEPAVPGQQKDLS